LALDGPLALEIDSFTAALKCSGLSLTGGRDTLTWVGGDGSGSVTAKNVYAALHTDRETVVQPSWLTRIWTWQLPLKYKLFLWLGASDKLLTWENLQRKGRHGPGLCVLCREATEDIHHLFLQCKFAQTVWLHILHQLSLPFHWTGASFPECFATWTFDLAAPPSLAVYVSWHLWIERNKTLFEDISPSYRAVCYRTLSSFNWQQSSIKPILHKSVDLSLPAGHTVAFFDGAAKSTGICSGAGGIFKMHPERTTKWYLCCGRGPIQRPNCLAFG